MKKILRFLKTQWRTLLVLAWMVFVTLRLTDIEKAARYSDSSYEVRQLEATIEDIESDISIIKKEVTPKYHKYGTLRKTVDDIYKKVRYQ